MADSARTLKSQAVSESDSEAGSDSARSLSIDGGVDEADVSSRAAFLGFWTLPLIASLMMLVVGVGSFSHQPGRIDWDEMLATNANYNPSKDKITYAENDRKIFRIYRIVVWSLTVILDAVVLSRKARIPPTLGCQGVLPKAQVAFNVYRILMASVEIWTLFSATCNNPYVNAGFGMYGWASAFGSKFPNMGFTDLVHILLGIVASVSLTFMFRVASSSSGFEDRELWQRLLFAGCLGVVFWYPIYDAKHWYIGSHLGNLGGEYLPVFAFLSALFECLRIFKDQEVSYEYYMYWQFEAMLDWFQVAMLSLAMFKFVWDLKYSSASWGSPNYYPDDGVPPEFSLMIGQVNLSESWKKSVVFGLNLGGMIILFILVEICGCFQHDDKDEYSFEVVEQEDDHPDE